MEPRPVGRGRIVVVPASSLIFLMRQWSRGRLAAEGRRRGACLGRQGSVNGAAAGWPRKVMLATPTASRNLRVNGAAAGWPRKVVTQQREGIGLMMRQWSRGRLAAEGARYLSRRSFSGTASMEPRPVGRGRARPGRSRGSTFLRQWSRGRLAAEGCNRVSAHSRISCVNGAAAGWPRKVVGRLLFGIVRQASMEPRPVGRGRPTRCTTACAGPTSVNGAAAGWPRKAAHAPDLFYADALRQWSRGRLAAEGPRAARRCHGGRSGVNGAAAGWPRNASTWPALARA